MFNQNKKLSFSLLLLALGLGGAGCFKGKKDEAATVSGVAVDTSSVVCKDLQDCTATLIKAMGVRDSIQKMFDAQFEQIKKMTGKEASGEDLALANKIRDFLSSDAFITDLGTIYAKYFDIAEIKELTVFYNSKIGQKLQKLQAEIANDLMEVSQKGVQKIAEEHMANLKTSSSAKATAAMPKAPSTK
ncbi:MAG TPA: DUF2059 domain-containing protein [Candidatus Babeliales bacterium]|nr:DUF2059 domain-containing protein [Candidatus Babeliales bacterium]